MEYKIYNSLSTEIFASLCVYKLLIYIYIYIYIVIWSQPFTKTFCLELDSNCKHNIRSHNRLSHPILKQCSIFIVHI